MIISDVHTHTDYFHGKSTVEEMYQAAVKKGLRYYGFSEHTPLPEGFSCLLYKEGDMHENFRLYIQDVLALKEHVEKEYLAGNTELPKVLLGMELDFTPHDMAYMDKLINAYPFDYIIGTIHFLDDRNIGLWKSGEANEAEKSLFFEEYYQAIRDLALWGKADIIAHPDFVKLHCVEDFRAWLETDRAKHSVQEALRAIKANNMLMEVSTGGLKKKCTEIHPSPRIMEWAAEIGVEISLGSDCHNTETVAYAFDELEEFVRSYGYQEYTVLIERKAHKIRFQFQTKKEVVQRQHPSLCKKYFAITLRIYFDAKTTHQLYKNKSKVCYFYVENLFFKNLPSNAKKTCFFCTFYTY